MAGGQDGTFSFVPAMVLKPWKQTETLPDAEKIITSINLARRLYTRFLKIDQDCYVKPRVFFQLSWPGVRKHKSASSSVVCCLASEGSARTNIYITSNKTFSTTVQHPQTCHSRNCFRGRKGLFSGFVNCAILLPGLF